MIQIKKYPRTKHIEGSRLQEGDHDLAQTPFADIVGKYLVIEEKMDGANSGISFSDEGELLLQSRGHYLTGGYRERHFNLFKTWANTFQSPLYEVLGNRYIMYGEWLYAKHTVFYNNLSHYFMEFDIYDKQEEKFLSTEVRHQEFIARLPFVQPVKVLYSGLLKRQKSLMELLTTSYFIKNQHLEDMTAWCEANQLNAAQVLQETDSSKKMEGLYLKVEENGIVTERYKWVRYDFFQTANDSGSHWLDRPIIPNQLAEGVNLFSF